MNTRDLIDRKITLEDDTWTVINTGVVRGSMIYCHLMSTTRSLPGVKRDTPVQSCRFVPLLDLGEDARQLIQLYT